MIDHVQGILDGMQARDVHAVVIHLAEDVILHSPIVSEPFVGKTAVVGVLGLLLGLMDRFEPKRVMRDGDHSATAFSFVSGDVHIDGMDYVRTNATGLVDFLSVTWRPLPEIVRMQNRIAPVLGIPAMTLVEHAAGNTSAPGQQSETA